MVYAKKKQVLSYFNTLGREAELQHLSTRKIWVKLFQKTEQTKTTPANFVAEV